MGDINVAEFGRCDHSLTADLTAFLDGEPALQDGNWSEADDDFREPSKRTSVHLWPRNVAACGQSAPPNLETNSPHDDSPAGPGRLKLLWHHLTIWEKSRVCDRS